VLPAVLSSVSVIPSCTNTPAAFWAPTHVEAVPNEELAGIDEIDGTLMSAAICSTGPLKP
jgi:hypothetical protein